MLLEEKHPVIVLKDVPIKYLLLILEYVYLGKVELRAEDVTNFKDVAQNLQVEVEFDDSIDPMSEDLLHEVSTPDHNMSLYSDDTMGRKSFEDMMEYSVSSTQRSVIGRKLENDDAHKKGPAPKKVKRSSPVIPAAVQVKKQQSESNKNSPCMFCDRLMRERDRKYHQRFCWQNANRISSDCAYCDKRFQIPGKLRLHMTTVHPEIPY